MRKVLYLSSFFNLNYESVRRANVAFKGDGNVATLNFNKFSYQLSHSCKPPIIKP